jgi:hypothetical protein
MSRPTGLSIASWAGISLAVAGLVCSVAVAADNPPPINIAVYGDAPYGTTPTDNAELQATPAFIESVNDDQSVSFVVHVGDIHSGKQYCTQGYDLSIYNLWTQFSQPLVYTPGDNEWTDCHKAGEGGGTYNKTTGQIDYVLDANGNPIGYAKGDPVANLALIRSIFFSEPGWTLGKRVPVLSQAFAYDRRFPADAAFVENVLWLEGRVLFVTINVPGGSNNDGDAWYKAPAATQAQLTESATRTAADIRWLDTAFTLAKFLRLEGVVIVTQADMWDLDGTAPGASGQAAPHLAGYESLVDEIAAKTLDFRKPVLLFNGDSHVYRSDNPLVKGAACVREPSSGQPAVPCDSTDDDWFQHPFYDVPNFHRIVVHGSTFPLEWLKLSIDPRAKATNGPTSFGPFSWQRMTQPAP